MGTLLDNGKYQVIENLLEDGAYSASVCIDVETKNNYKPLIFNIYKDQQHISSYLPLFHGIQPSDCDDFNRVIPGDRLIMAVFSYHTGTPLIEHLETIDKKDYPARARLIGSFLDAAIVLDMLPPAFAVCALTEPCTVLDTKENAVRFNFIIKPVADPQSVPVEQKRALFLNYLEKAIVKDRYLPEIAEDFLEEMRTADVSKFVPICAAWRKIAGSAMEQHEEHLKESFIGYIKRRLKRKFQKKQKHK